MTTDATTDTTDTTTTATDTTAADATATTATATTATTGAVDGDNVAADAGKTAGDVAAKNIKDPNSILGGEHKDAKEAPANWPEDWRARLAKGDDKKLARLARFTGPESILESYLNLEAKTKQGAAKSALPDNATDDQLKAWRTENGIPEKPEDYEVKPPEGFVFGEADKPLLESFKKHAHAKNWSPDQLNQAAEWYANEQGQMAERQAIEDSTFKVASEDTLRSEWGAEYRPNLAGLENWMETWPEGLAGRILGGRTADGKKLGADPVFLNHLLSLQKELYPSASVVPAGTNNAPKAIADRIEEINTIMREDNDRYVHSKPLQDELMALHTALERQQKPRAA